MTRFLVALLVLVLGAAPAPAFDVGKLLGGVNLVGVEQEAEIAATFAKDVESKKRLVGDRAVQSYVSRVGARLARGRKIEFPWRFRVVQDADVNAYNIGGGYVYVNSGLIRAARTEGELAAVMAHEMGHQAKRHVAKTISRQHLFSSLASFATGGSSQWLQLAAGLGVTTGQLHFGREAEREADRVMIDLMVAGGYDPREALSLFETLRRIQGDRRGIAFLSSHPATKERAENVSRRIAQKGVRGGLTRDTGEFRSVQARLGGRL